MIEKVNPSHPDKIADRIAGALVDMAYKKENNPKIAVEVLIGHGECNIIIESTVKLETEAIEATVWRIAGDYVKVNCHQVPQDRHLAENQREKVRCGDNGIFKGMPLTDEQRAVSLLARVIYDKYPTDGKYILDNNYFICCQSNADTKELKNWLYKLRGTQAIVNPLGDWTGGIDVDSGATNRKLGSDMADSVTGSGLHGKDLSKADVSLNILAFQTAQIKSKEINICCAIGDEGVFVDGEYWSYTDAVRNAREYIDCIGGFEKFAEWGLY